MMLITRVRGLLCLVGLMLLCVAPLLAAGGLFDFTLPSIDGEPTPLSNYKGKVILLVNVASKCGFTPQYSALEPALRETQRPGLCDPGVPRQEFRGARTRHERRDQAVLQHEIQRELPHVLEDFREGR